MNIKLSFTIGIPAYNEEANIYNLLQTIRTQKKGKYKVEKIIVVSDGSNDQTVKKVNKFSGIECVIGKTRKGKFQRLNELFRKSDSEYLILLDADCVLKSDALSQMANTILQSEVPLSLITAKAVPIIGNSFMEKVLLQSVEMKERVIASWNKGKNVYAFRGSCLTIHKRIYKHITIPNGPGTDAYLYFYTRIKGGSVALSKKTQVFYNLPNTYNDHFKQSARFINSQKIMAEYFGLDVMKEYEIPVPIAVKAFFIQFIKSPLCLSCYVVFLLTIKLKTSRKKVRNEKPWTIAESTKHAVQILASLILVYKYWK